MDASPLQRVLAALSSIVFALCALATAFVLSLATGSIGEGDFSTAGTLAYAAGAAALTALFTTLAVVSGGYALRGGPKRPHQ